MDVGSDGAFALCFKADVFAEQQVFADLGDFCFDGVFDGEAVAYDCIGSSKVSSGGGDQGVSDAANESLEVIVLGNEVGLAVDFEQEAGFAASRDACGDGAFVGFAVSFFGSFGNAFFAQQGDGGIDVAIGFFERAFAVHHARVGFVAEFFNSSSSNHKCV